MRNDNWLKGAHPSDLMWVPNHREDEGVAGFHSSKTYSLSEVKVTVSL